MIYEFFRWFGLITAYPVQLLFFKRKTYCENGNKRLKRIKGGALIISNHFSVLDYMMNIFAVMPRKLNVVAAELAFKNPFVRFGMRFFGGIQANRVSKSLKFVDESAAVINKGQLVQIFPEGHNTPDGTIKDFKTTYIMIAHRANAPIIPIVSDGNYGFFKRASIIIGEPIYLMDFCPEGNMSAEKVSQINEAIRNKVCELRATIDELNGR
jgi:1-acyl-sn-glycerol-3-phosphate acyltransferase